MRSDVNMPISAESNSWYILMTLHGEQTDTTIDIEKHENNKKEWNDYILSELESHRQMGRLKQSDIRAELMRQVPGAFSGQKVAENRRRILYLYNDAITERTKHGEMLSDLPSINDFAGFSGLEFDNILCCDEFLFPANVINISNCAFRRAVYLRNAVFADHVFFCDSKFESLVHLSGSYFNSSLNIKNSDFLSISTMKSCQFASDFELCDSRFHSTSMGNSKFLGRVTMTRCTLNESFRFDDSKFTDATYFSECKFNSISFSSVEFRGPVSFKNNNIYKMINFHDARFCSIARFTSTIFFQGVSFLASVFEKHSYFDDCDFYSSTASSGEVVSFENCSFLAPATFQRSSFKNCYPLLTGLSLTEVVLFSAKDRHWPESTDQDPEEIIETCSAIRHCYSKQGLPDEEHFFFRREMDAKGKVGNWAYRLPFMLFKAVSNYGDSIKRPAYFLLALWFFGFATFWGYFGGCCYPRPIDGIDHPVGTAFGFSLSNVLPVFGFRRIYFGDDFMDSLPSSLIFMSSAQTILSFPLLFFLGLGFRQRFRLR